MPNRFYNNDGGWGALAKLVLCLVVAAFLVGAVALDKIQWIHPAIAEQIAALKQQEVKRLAIENDAREQQAKLELRKQEAQKAQALESAREWDRRWQEWLGALMIAVSNLLFWGPLTVIGMVMLKWAGILQILPQVATAFAAAFHTSPEAVHTFASTADVFETHFTTVEPPIIAREQTTEEKERYRAERERARQRERDQRAFAQRRAAQVAREGVI
jgi:hypothetical protein